MNSIKTAKASEIAKYLRSLLDKANEIDNEINNSTSYDEEYRHPVWRKLFDTVFSDKISKVIYDRFPDFDPYIPDTSYGEDVTAFIREFEIYVSRLGSNEEVEFPSFEDWSSSNN